jgi:hypothetical protein
MPWGLGESTEPNNTVLEGGPTSSLLVKETVDAQQERLFRCPRVEALMKSFDKILTVNSGTHLHDLAYVHRRVWMFGRPARPFTMGGVFAKTRWPKEDCDYYLLTPKEFENMILEGPLEKNVVIRDPTAIHLRCLDSLEKHMEREVWKKPEDGIDVQMLGRAAQTQMAVERITIKDAYDLWQKTDGKEISDAFPPLNCLNQQEPTISYIPEGLRLCRLLSNAVQEDARTRLTRMSADLPTVGKLAHRVVADRAPKDTPGSDPSRAASTSQPGGRDTGRTILSNDLSSCERFSIRGQAGAGSGPHCDMAGVTTYVTLVGNKMDGHDEEDEEVIKFWPSLLEKSFRIARWEELMHAFAEEGASWSPELTQEGDDLWSVLALVKGDTFIQRPGNIHAPINLTNTRMVGGMVMDHRDISNHLSAWLLIAENMEYTNEPLPAQTYHILTDIKKEAKYQQEKGNIAPSEYEGILEMCDKISGMAIVCSCHPRSGCSSLRCSCFAANVPCGSQCHKSHGPKTKCVNTHNAGR